MRKQRPSTTFRHRNSFSVEILELNGQGGFVAWLLGEARIFKCKVHVNGPQDSTHNAILLFLDASPPKAYRVVPDSAVRHIWKDPDTDEEVEVSPEWYELNGTPSNVEGRDFKYVRTEIDTSVLS